MIIRVSFMVVASVAALKISQTITSSPTKRNGTIKSPGSDGSHLELEFEEKENGTANANHVIQDEEEKQIETEMPQNLLTGEFEDSKLLIGGKKMDDVTEMELLKNLVHNYKQRGAYLERKLIELKSLKEKQSAIAQMQKQIEKKTSKLDSLKTTIASLESENKTIREKIRDDGAFSKKQLDIAKKKINEMKRKMDVNGSPVKDQILMLQHQVTQLQKYNSSGRNNMVNKKLKDVQDTEFEALELKRKNKELELEKREIGIKLATAQKRIRTEKETMAQIQEEITGLRHVHEELSQQVERLQRNRFDMVQELVYQRWLYTCLRFEAQDHQYKIRKASSLNSSKELYGKSHASTSDPELESISSNTTLNESDEIETTTLESSSSSQSSSSKNSSLLHKMKRWRRSKDYTNKISPKGRNSPSSPAQIQSSSKSLEKPIMHGLKRVSFSDSVKPTIYHDLPGADEDVIEDKETNYGQSKELNSTIMSWDKHKAEQYDKPNNNSNEYAVGNPINIDSTAENEGSQNQSGHSDELYSRNEVACRNDDRIKTQMVQLVAFFFFLLILLAYFRIK